MLEPLFISSIAFDYNYNNDSDSNLLAF